MFAGFLKLADVCPACGFDLRRAESGDGPAVFIILIVGFVACFGALFTDLALRPPIWLTLSIWLPLAALLALGLLRPFKGVMIALQFHNRAAEARHGQP
jgi:uncharacterized protein (DUF983 family)